MNQRGELGVFSAFHRDLATARVADLHHHAAREQAAKAAIRGRRPKPLQRTGSVPDHTGTGLVRDVVMLGGPKRLIPGHGQGPGPIVIYGSRIPSGVELSIGYRQDPQDKEISFTLIVAGAPLSCTSIPDNGPHGND